MKPISPRPIFTLSLFTTANHRIIKNSHFLAFSTQTQQNSGSGYHRGRHDEESRAVRVSVWWDFENCNLPLNTNAFRVSQCIINAVRANGIKGPVQITAFGDVMQISRTNQEALSSTGINFSHVPAGGKNSADRSLLVDLMHWVSQNPPPAHLFLISGDRDFAGVLHRLRMNNYNILLASPDSAPSVLCSAATIMWQWSSLLKGENLSGKLFNQPPDGPYNSWYGHHKAPLEDPFACTEQSSCGPPEVSSELAAEVKIRPIPKAVMNHICQILNPHPDGISIIQLRAELNKTGCLIDKDFYGYKKFSRFLLSMPNVLKLSSGSDGQFIVQGVSNKFLDESLPAEAGSVVKINGKKSSCDDVTEKSTVPEVPEPKRAQSTKLQEAHKAEKQNDSSLSTNSQEIKMKACAENMQDSEKEEQQMEPSQTKNKQGIPEDKRTVNLQEQPEKFEVASPLVETKDSPEKNENQILVRNDRSSTSDIGVFRKIWMKLFGSEDTNCTDKNCVKQDEALSGNDGNIAKSGVTDIFSQDSSFSNRIVSWFKFWNSRDKVEKNGEIADSVKVNSKQIDIFSEGSFWNELESFIDTLQGSICFSQSRNRVDLVQNLKNEGPPFLQSLSESDLLRLVDLLISDKKWVKECDSRTFPFKLTRPAGKDARNIPSVSSNGLSQMFSDKQPNSHEFVERKLQNPPHTGVQTPSVHKDSSIKTKRELLADCQIVVDHIAEEYPEGFSMGAFRKLFLKKHGYRLDLQKLGYEKLINLLQIMPRVRIESNSIFPAGEFKIDLKNIDIPIQENNKVRNSPVSAAKDDDSDSSWDELGPVNKSGPGKEKIDPRVVAKRGKKTKIDYEPLKEYEASDSEEETSSGEEIKPKSEKDSSLLQILDSWHREGDLVKGKPKSTTKAADSTPTKNEFPVEKSTRKTNKSGKSYSFVTEQLGDDSKDALVTGILGSLKKTGEKSADSGVLN